MVAQKDKNIEYMRAIACVGVVLIHVFKSAHDIYVELPQWLLFLCSLIVNNLRWCVPVFLMITGYLLLDPAKEISLKKIGRYIWRVFVVLAVFGTGFALMELVFTEKTITLVMFPKAIVNMLAGKTWDHLWYLYTLIVIYCFLPLLRAGVSALKLSELKFVCIVILAFTCLLPTVEALGFTFGISSGIMSVYMLYMLVGYLLKKRLLEIPLCGSIVGLVVSTAFLSTMAYVSDVLGKTVNNAFISHASIAVIIQSVCIFSLMLHIREAKHQRIDRAVMSLAAASFGIYILHMFFINLLYKVINFSPVRYGAVIMLPVFILTLVLTYATVVILKKIPVVRKYL